MIDGQTTGTGAIGGTHRTEAYLPLEFAKLRADEDIPFDLFVKNGEQFVLFRKAHLPLTLDDLRSFKARGVTQFYVDGRAKKILARYMEQELAVRLKDPNLPLDEKASFLMEASRIIMDDLFTHPESPETLPRVRTLVENTVGFIATGRQAFRSVIRLCTHDYYTYTHTLHVEVYSVALGLQLGMSQAFLRKLGEGALLHDVGKALVPPEILTKPGPLTPEEWQVMKQHPQLGIDLLAAHGPLDEVTRWAIIGHHERIDGRGYPFGLQKDEVALPGRIVALADIYDALTTNRSYHAAARSFDALNIIKEHMLGGVDAELFKELVILLARNDPNW
jgi:HD-GYP domain-containing protein (c-di-GMP phosphodiesterase class II)